MGQPWHLYFRSVQQTNNTILTTWGAWIAEWSSHLTTINIGTLRPGPRGRSLVTTILFWLKHNIYARKTFRKTE